MLSTIPGIENDRRLVPMAFLRDSLSSYILVQSTAMMDIVSTRKSLLRWFPTRIPGYKQPPLYPLPPCFPHTPIGTPPAHAKKLIAWQSMWLHFCSGLKMSYRLEPCSRPGPRL
jgi:hypothetical protein